MGTIPEAMPKVIYATVLANSQWEARRVLYEMLGDLALFIEPVEEPIPVEGPWKWRFKLTLDGEEGG